MTPYRPQGNSVSERMYSTVHAMLSMYSDISQNIWAEASSQYVFYLSDALNAVLLDVWAIGKITCIDIIFGIPHVGRSTTTEEFTHSTRKNLQIAFELAHRNLSERTDRQKANNYELRLLYRNSPPDKRCGVFKPHKSTDGPNPKLIQLWRGPYLPSSKL